VHFSADPDLHTWRQAHAKEFACFFRLLQLYLIIPGTSDVVESLFTKAKRALDRFRLRIKPEIADLLVYLREDRQYA
jgi:hypothetical protein